MKTRVRVKFALAISAIALLTLNACQLTQTFQAMLATDTPTPTMTFTPTATATFTLTPTATMTFTPTATATATNTPRPSSTSKPVSAEPSCNGANSVYESATVALINQERASAGVGALSVNGSLTSAARAHSQDMATNNFFSHTGSDGSDPFSRMATYGYSVSAGAENIFAGESEYNTSYSAVSGWMDSDLHRTNMLNGTYNEVGVGYWCNPNSDYQGYFTADFGRR